MNIQKNIAGKKFIPAVIWFLLILILLCLPGAVFPPTPRLVDIHFDKIVHCGLFSMLVFLWFRPFIPAEQSMPEKRKLIIYIAISALVYGTAMEFVQKYWIPNRSFDVYDILADGVGSFLPVLFFGKMMRWRKKAIR